MRVKVAGHRRKDSPMKKTQGREPKPPQVKQVMPVPDDLKKHEVAFKRSEPWRFVGLMRPWIAELDAYVPGRFVGKIKLVDWYTRGGRVFLGYEARIERRLEKKSGGGWA